MTDTINVPRELLLFILGEKELHGIAFGDPKPPLGKFWWRNELRALLQAPVQPAQVQGWQWMPDVDALAAFIRQIDGNNSMGAGTLAENICEWLAVAPKPPVEAFCLCNDEISLQMASGGGAKEGLFGRLTLKINGEYVCYLREESKQPVQEPVAWQFFDDGKWWNGDDRIKDHRVNTVAAGYPVRDLYAAPQPSDDVAKDAYLRGLKDQKKTFEEAYTSTSCFEICENKTSDGLRAMDKAIDAAMAGGGE